MPFDDGTANAVYEHCTMPICKEFNLEVERADEIFTTNPILEDITSAINRAAVIIADISGKNPNVFYELGLSHMLKTKQTIMVTQDDFKSIPFDISHFRIIQYKNTIPGKSAYEKQLRETLKNILLDYKLLYRDDFETLINFLSKEDMLLYQFIALAKSPKPLHRNEKLHVEGSNRKNETCATSLSSVEEISKPFIQSDFAKSSGDLVIVTDKGKAFVEILEEKGYVCDFVNGHILSEDYIAFGERMNLYVQKKKEKRKISERA
jgi:hypothetical protein